MISTVAWILAVAANVVALVVALKSRGLSFADAADDAAPVARQRLATLAKIAAAQVLVVVVAGGLNLISENERVDLVEARYGDERLLEGESSAHYYIARDTAWFVGAGVIMPVIVSVLLARRSRRNPS